MYQLLEQELQSMVSGYNSAYLALAGTAFGGFLSLLITYITVSLPEGLSLKCFAALLITAISTVVLGVLAARDVLRSRATMKMLKKETVDLVVRTGTKQP
jgi:hypothetical protein